MDIFISYRGSSGSADRDLRQFIDRACVGDNTGLQYRFPFLNRTHRFWNLPKAMLDLEISRASARAATLVIALLGAREATMFRSSGLTRLLRIISPRLAPAGHGLGGRTSWSSFDFRAARTSYCNFLSIIGIGNATRNSVAIKRLVLLGDPDLIVRHDRDDDNRRCLPLPDVAHRLFLEEIGRDQTRDQQPLVSALIAGLALVPGDRRSALLRLGEEALERRPAPVMADPEHVTWLIPEDAPADPLSLAAFSHASPNTLRISVEELRASIIVDNLHSLRAPRSLASRGMADKRSVSRLKRLSRFLRTRIFSTSSKRLPKVKQLSKYQSRKKARRVSHLATDISEIELCMPSVRAAVGTRGLQPNINSEHPFYVPYLNLLGEHPKIPPQLLLPEDGISWPDVSAGREPDDHDFDDPAEHEDFICGMFISYRRKVGGTEPDKVFREVLEVRAGPDGPSFVMSVADCTAQGSQPQPWCEGKVREVEGAQLLIENAPKGSRTGRMVSLFVDPTEECEASSSCRIGAVTSRVRPRRRRLQTGCILLVRVRGTPPDRDEFFAQVTSAGPFDELIGRDFGNDAADLDYVRELLSRQFVDESTAGSPSSVHQRKGRQLTYSEVDVHPFECGLNDIVERALASPTVVAPFKEAWWRDRSAAPKPPGAAGDRRA